MVWEQESEHCAPGWKPGHLREDAESFWKNWVASSARWAGAGCSGSEQRLRISHKEGTTEGAQAEGISQAVLDASQREGLWKK